MFKKNLILGLGFLAISSSIFAQSPTIGASVGVPIVVIDAGSLAAALGQAPFDYSLLIGNNGASAVTWQTIYSAAPTTVTVLLQGSTDCLNYATIDTSTNINGEIRSVFGSFKCLRVNNSVVTGGAGKTLTVKFVYTTGRVASTGGNIYLGGTFTNPILLPDGTVAAPSVAFSSAPSSGFFNSSGYPTFTRLGVAESTVGTGTLFVNSLTLNLASQDVILSRATAATLQQGAADSATPVNQTLQAQGVGAGTSNTAGANYVFKPGLGRGNAVPGVLTLNRSIVTTTGNSAQAQSSGLVICGTKTLSTTSAQAQTIITVTTTTLTSGGLTLFYNVSATSATAADADTGSVNVSWNNVGGTVNAVMGTVINAVQSNSSGTLASTPTVTVATNVVSIKLTPTWVTIVPTEVRGAFTVLNQGIDPIVCQ
jgi:hypothetical protein